jgi:hypothetical protein
LVRTRWRANTKPEPSIRREQLGAVPSILTMLGRARVRPTDFSTVGSGAGTRSVPSAPSAPNTWVYGPRASSCRKSLNIRLTSAGMIRSTPRSTAELFTWREISGNGA